MWAQRAELASGVRGLPVGQRQGQTLCHPLVELHRPLSEQWGKQPVLSHEVGWEAWPGSLGPVSLA